MPPRTARGYDLAARLRTAATSALDDAPDLSPCQIARQIDDALVALRKSGRRAIRILDIGCGDGGWLIEAASYAAALGFLAIEGRGFDIAPPSVDQARRAAECIVNPRIGLSFKIADAVTALAQEDDHGADIMLCHYGVIADLPVSDHDRVVQEILRVCAGALIRLGGTQ